MTVSATKNRLLKRGDIGVRGEGILKILPPRFVSSNGFDFREGLRD